MSWKTDRMINNNAYINKVSKVIFVQAIDREYTYDDTTDDGDDVCAPKLYDSGYM